MDKKTALLIFWKYIEESEKSKISISLMDGRKIIVHVEEEDPPRLQLVKPEIDDDD